MTSDIKNEIKVNNSADNEQKNFFISVPKEEVGRLQNMSDTEENPMQDTPQKELSLKRKREEEEDRKTPSKSDPDFEADKEEKDDNKEDNKDDNKDDKERSKVKVLSLNEAKKKMSGYERRFC